MHTRIFAGAIGIGAVAWLPRLEIDYLFSALCLALLCAGLRITRRCEWSVFCLCFCLGASWSLVYGMRLVNSLLPTDIELQPLVISGRVVELPETGSRGGEPYTRFVLKVTGATCEEGQRRCFNALRRVRLSWADAPDIAPGQHWRLLVKLQRPHGFMNPGGFDYQTWLVRQGIGAVGYVQVDSMNRLQDHDRSTLDYRRWQLASILDREMAGLVARPVLKALILADKRELRPWQWQLFERHGIIHLMVISGLHVGLVSGLLFGLVRLCSLVTPWRARSMEIAAVSSLIGALVYCLLAGATLPTQRACIMVAVFMAALLRRRQQAIASGMCWALLLCLLWDPLAVVTPSFWLSFGAVFVLMAGLSGAVPARSRWLQALRGQWVVFAGLLPLSITVFGHFSATAPLVNLWVVPLFSLLVVPLALLGLPLAFVSGAMARWCWQCCDYLVAGMVDGLKALDNLLPFEGLVVVPQASLPLLALGVTGTALLIAPKGFPLRTCGVLLLIPLLVYQPEKPAEGELNLTVLDVGQGLSIVVETAGHTLIYDVGARFEDDDQSYFSLAEVVLVPFLRSRGIGSVDTLVLSHADNDHAGAWPELSSSLPVNRIYTGEPVPNLSSLPCAASPAWVRDGISFDFLPAATLFEENSAAAREVSSNDRSCVLSIRAGAYHWLLPGDIGSEIEQRLVLSEAENLSASVLIAPHHGSHSSSSWAFLKWVRPDHVVFSSGYRNRFGHPDDKIVRRYQRFGTKLHSTSEHGAVTFHLREGRLLTPTHYRSGRKRYWL